MQIIVSYPRCFQVPGVVLSAGAGVIRVAMRDWDDVAEFRLQGGAWIAENGDRVEVEEIGTHSWSGPAIAADWTGGRVEHHRANPAAELG